MRQPKTAPRERGITFAPAMVRALLSGDKTQTRRIVAPTGKGQSVYFSPDNKVMMEYRDGWGGYVLKCPFGEPGDNLYVRETHMANITPEPGDPLYFYRASEPYGEPGPWTSARFMPKRAARIWLLLVSVRAERLQDISEADAIAEGVLPLKVADFGDDIRCIPRMGSDPLTLFAHYFDALHGWGTWKTNPDVWVLTFRRLKP